MQMCVIGGDWNTIEDIEKDFGESLGEYQVLIAAYSCEDYSGSAYVLCVKDGLLYEVEGSHCSCYGLEEQWKPEEVSLQYLQNRLEKGSFPYGCGADISELLRQFIGQSREEA